MIVIVISIFIVILTFGLWVYNFLIKSSTFNNLFDIFNLLRFALKLHPYIYTVAFGKRQQNVYSYTLIFLRFSFKEFYFYRCKLRYFSGIHKN